MYKDGYNKFLFLNGVRTLNLCQFINDNVYIISVVLFIIGLFLKKTPKIPNWLIPYILSVLGIGMCIIMLEFSLNAIMQGIIGAGVAVYVHQLGKQGSVIRNNNSK